MELKNFYFWGKKSNSSKALRKIQLLFMYFNFSQDKWNSSIGHPLNNGGWWELGFSLLGWKVTDKQVEEAIIIRVIMA